MAEPKRDPLDAAAVLLCIGVSLPILGSHHTASAAAPPGAASEAATAATGTVAGTITYVRDRKRPWRFSRIYVRDRKTGRLSDTVVCLDVSPATDASENRQPISHTVDQKDYRFIPETLAIQAGDPIRFTNSDALLHDVTTRQVGADGALKQDSFSLRQRQENAAEFRDAGGVERPVELSCRFHGSMRAWIFVFHHPHFQVTPADGNFRLEGVPVGMHRLVVHHAAGSLRWETAIDIVEGETLTLDIELSPDDLLVPVERR